MSCAEIEAELDQLAPNELRRIALKSWTNSELPLPQRLTLARILLDLSDESADFSPDIEAAWKTEICRRMKEVKKGRARCSGFDQVFARLDQRFPAYQLI